MAKTNENLNKMRVCKNDEFYTKLEDVENELRHYTKEFENKTVYCCCDNPDTSNFVSYFVDNFDVLGLRKLIVSFYSTEVRPYVMVYSIENTYKRYLTGDGNCLSSECRTLLNEADIVVTNPPFSIYHEFVDMLVSENKKFLIVGTLSTIAYKNIFPLMQLGEIKLGYNTIHEFIKPDGGYKKFGNTIWLTNLDRPYPDKLILRCKYDSELYPKYDNYDAIEVSKVKNIPYDYDEVMGVPLTFMSSYNPEQFTIVGMSSHIRTAMVNGKQVYTRIFIKRK